MITPIEDVLDGSGEQARAADAHLVGDVVETGLGVA